MPMTFGFALPAEPENSLTKNAHRRTWAFDPGPTSVEFFEGVAGWVAAPVALTVASGGMLPTPTEQQLKELSLVRPWLGLPPTVLPTWHEIHG